MTMAGCERCNFVASSLLVSQIIPWYYLLESFLSFVTPVGRECYFVPELCEAELWKCAVDSSLRNIDNIPKERLVPFQWVPRRESFLWYNLWYYLCLERFRHELPISTSLTNLWSLVWYYLWTKEIGELHCTTFCFSSARCDCVSRTQTIPTSRNSM
jgi:hypothetical protein